MISAFSLGVLALSAAIIVVAERWRHRQSIWSTLPWVGGDTAFAKAFSPFLSAIYGERYLQEAYEKYNKANKICVLPGILGNSVVLPSSYVPWLSTQPETLLSAGYAQVDALQTERTMFQPPAGTMPVHSSVVRRDLNGHLSDLAQVLVDEISCAVDEIWGTNSDLFVQVNLDATLRRIVARASNRVFVGAELCRNNHFLDNAIRHANDILMSGLFLRMFPTSIRSLLSVIVTLPNRVHFRRCARHLKPFFARSIERYQSDKAGLPKQYSTWSIQKAMKAPSNDIERTPEMLSRRMMALNFAAIHTSTMTTASLLLDIASCPPEQRCLEWLRAEGVASAEKFGSTWNSVRLRQTVRLDSALRESMRLSGFIAKTLSRKVMPSEGVHLPDGTHVPQGTIVCVCGWGTHHDASIYNDPYKFVYDRFVRRLEGEEKEGLTKTAAETEPDFAIFGHGKHACPGRFFAVDLIKLIVTHLLTHYEIESLSQRPDQLWGEYSPVPPLNASLCVRRRKQSSRNG